MITTGIDAGGEVLAPMEEAIVRRGEAIVRRGQLFDGRDTQLHDASILSKYSYGSYKSICA